MGVLNFPLFRSLESRFGGARVTHDGEPMEGFHARDPITGEMGLQVVDWGERYHIDCPFCTDTRSRLAVCHRYGEYDEASGRRLIGLWKCFNTECQSEWENRVRFRDMVESTMVWSRQVRVPHMVRVPAGELPAVDLPGETVPLSELSADHPARRYLADRRFDPDAVSDRYGVGFATKVTPRSREAAAEGRLILPVVSKKKVVGWQARFVGEADWKALGVPKYLTFFPKSKVLYDLDEAVNHDPIVVVEGVTDVWRYGDGAVSRLGKRLSVAQTDLLVRRASGRTVVFVSDGNDPEALSFTVKDCKDLVNRGFRGKVSLYPLKKVDPASLTTDHLRRLVSRAAAAAVELSPS